MARGLDHIVHAVRDLDAAADFYRRAGFVVGARNRHPWGTHNCIVQTPGFFIEVITVGEPERIPRPKPGVPSFGAAIRDFLAREEGLSMLVLEGKGAAADAAAFRAAGIGSFEVFDFEREAKRPDGATVKVGFSLAFAVDANAPDTGFFTCQQHYPENFWNPAFQNHPNGVTGIAGVTMVAANPDDHGHFLAAFTGAGAVKSDGDGIAIETPRGVIEVLNPAGFRRQFALDPPDISGGGRLAAIHFAVSDTLRLKSALDNAEVAAAGHAGRIIVPPQAAHGAT